MSLKTVIETTEGLNEALIPFYTEQDGKFILQIDGVREHPDVANLRVAYDREKEGAKALKTEIADLKTQIANLPEDFDAEKWAKLKDGKPDEAALVALRKELEAERDEWKGKYESATETARKNAVDRDLTDALSANGVIDPLYMKAARTMLANQVKIGEDGLPIVETDMGPMPLAEHVKRWTSGEGKGFVDPGKGGGAKGSEGGGGTITAEQFAAMGDKQRVELFNTDPERFKELSGS